MSIDLSLDRINQLVRHLPPYTRPTCHIAGTNGKGSVSSLIHSILRSSSPPLSVGRYNSPHLVSIYDSIVLNDLPIDPPIYAKARAIVERADKEHNTALSSFELLTLTALLIFEQANLDIVVIEVGLGGRLDATNIIPDEAILVSALTAVDLDHQAFLGNTVADIAKEKASIARAGRPFVLGPQKHRQVEDVATRIVEQAGGEVVRAPSATARHWDDNIDGPKPPAFSLGSLPFKEPPPQPVKLSMACFPQDDDVYALLPLYGEHQLDNLGTAATVVSALLTHPACSARLNLASRINPESVSRGIKSVRWPGRLSFHTISIPHPKAPSPRPLIVLADGAHNPASSATLGAYIAHLLSLVAKNEDEQQKTINITYILALSHSPPKTPLQTLSPILPHPHTPPNVKLNVNVAVLRFTPPEGMPWVKSVPPSDLRDVVSKLVPGADVWVGGGADESSPDQLERALEQAAAAAAAAVGKDGDALVVLAGSLYLVADFYRLVNKYAAA